MICIIKFWNYTMVRRHRLGNGTKLARSSLFQDVGDCNRLPNSSTQIKKENRVAI